MAEIQQPSKILNVFDPELLPPVQFWCLTNDIQNPWIAVWDWWLGGLLTQTQHQWLHQSQPQWFIFSRTKSRVWIVWVPPFLLNGPDWKKRLSPQGPVGVLFWGNHLVQITQTWNELKNHFNLGIGLWNHGKYPQYCYFI